MLQKIPARKFNCQSRERCRLHTTKLSTAIRPLHASAGVRVKGPDLEKFLMRVASRIGVSELGFCDLRLEQTEIPGQSDGGAGLPAGEKLRRGTPSVSREPECSHQGTSCIEEVGRPRPRFGRPSYPNPGVRRTEAMPPLRHPIPLPGWPGPSLYGAPAICSGTLSKKKGVRPRVGG